MQGRRRDSDELGCTLGRGLVWRQRVGVERCCGGMRHSVVGTWIVVSNDV